MEASLIDVLNRRNFFIRYIADRTNKLFAEDIYQEALLITIFKQVNHFRSFFIAVVKKLIYTFNRKKQKVEYLFENLDYTEDEIIDRSTEYLVKFEQLQNKVFTTKKQDKQKVILALYRAGYTPKQIGEQIGWNNKSVTRQINRTCTNLKAYYEKTKTT